LLTIDGAPWPGPISRLGRVDSTSSYLLALAREGAPEWSAVIADAQTGGRGRLGRSWESPPGNLFLSVLLREAWRPGFPDSLVPLVAGVAVAKSLVGVAQLRLKWPNDVLCGDRKLGGILAEGIVTSGRLEGIVVGVGVNLDLDPGSLPAGLREQVTSLATETGRAPGRDALADRILKQLRAELAPPQRPERVLADWRERSVDWWGRRVRVDSAGVALVGIARDVDSSGGLVLELPDGGRQVVLSGEARQLRRATDRDARKR
jgi:BirA family transcriptional regulator, biotin operon repressor / biotin---[acetyl-CoA-carboxylase] ligase